LLYVNVYLLIDILVNDFSSKHTRIP